MIGGRVLIAGAARNCAAGLIRSLPRLERFRQSFDDVAFVIVTNDSTDETPQILARWAEGRTDTTILTVDGLADNAPQRAVRLAIARNLYLNHLRQRRQSGEHFDYLLVLDLDGVNAELVDEPAFSAAVARAPDDWIGVFGNQADKYYDIWALRHPEWCPTDCWAEVRARRRYFLIGRHLAKRARTRFINDRQITLPTDAAPVRVNSAFGGVGLYRVAALGDAHYVGLGSDGEGVCEHVRFHEMLAQARGNRGGGLYILPALTNSAPTEHL